MNENKTTEKDTNSLKDNMQIKNIIEWVKSLVLAGVITIFILNFVVFFAYVPTGSMIPTIQEGDRIIVWKIFRYFDWENRGLSYGDVVVFKHKETPNDEEKLLVKRVIGFGGDKIKIENGLVYRNNEPLVELYVKNNDSFFMNEIIVPDNELFVLGDNRIGSYDSRYWDYQTVPISDVVGEVKFLNK